MTKLRLWRKKSFPFSVAWNKNANRNNQKSTCDTHTQRHIAEEARRPITVRQRSRTLKSQRVPHIMSWTWIETVVQDYLFVERLVLDRHGHVPVLDTKVTVHDTSACLSRTRLCVAWGSGKHGPLLTQATGSLYSDHIAIASIVLGTAILRLVAAKLAFCKSPLPLRHSAQATKRPKRSIDATGRPHDAKPHTHRNATHHYTGTAPAILHRLRAGCRSSSVPLRGQDLKKRRADTLRWRTKTRKMRNRHRFFIFPKLRASHFAGYRASITTPCQPGRLRALHCFPHGAVLRTRRTNEGGPRHLIALADRFSTEDLKTRTWDSENRRAGQRCRRHSNKMVARLHSYPPS